jgi:hypothetical protein
MKERPKPPGRPLPCVENPGDCYRPCDSRCELAARKVACESTNASRLHCGAVGDNEGSYLPSMFIDRA